MARVRLALLLMRLSLILGMLTPLKVDGEGKCGEVDEAEAWVGVI